MKVVLVDPMGIAYGAELARGLCGRVDLTYVTKKNSVEKEDIKADTKYWFFGSSKSGKIARFTKGMGYIFAYVRLLMYIYRHSVEVVHIQWLSVPKIDNFFLKKLQSTKVKLVLTAHNVLPHRNSQKHIETCRAQYSYFDKIIIHGDSIKDEFLGYFPEYENKLSVVRHGIFDSLSTQVDTECVHAKLVEQINRAKKVGIFFGNMFPNKGVAELVSYWLANYSNNPEYFLIVVGKKDPAYIELSRLEPQIKCCENIFYKPQIIEEIELNTYIDMSNIVLMPYKHASMSGIVFKAAVLDRTVLSTDTGSIREYVDETCAFMASNLDTFFKTMDDIFLSLPTEKMTVMGVELGKHIRAEYSWDKIAQITVQTVYLE